MALYFHWASVFLVVFSVAPQGLLLGKYQLANGREQDEDVSRLALWKK